MDRRRFIRSIAAAGTGAAAYTGKKEAVVPAETVMTFTVSTTPASGATLKKRE